MAGCKNLFYTVNREVVWLRIGAVGQNWKVLCTPEENSLDTQKVVIAQSSVHTALWRNKVRLDSFSSLFKISLSGRRPVFSLLQLEGLNSRWCLLQDCKRSWAHARLATAHTQCSFSSNTWRLRRARENIQSCKVIVCLYDSSR